MGYEKSNSEDLFTKKKKLKANCIIPAAGLSSRMGCWKGELATREGIPFLENAVLTAGSVCSRVIVVGGYNFSRLKQILHNFPQTVIVKNKDFEKGMLSSIQRGLDKVSDDFFIMPMDMPLITPAVFIKVLNSSNIGKMNRPVYNDTPGHPVFIPVSWKDRIQSMEGKSLIHQVGQDELNLIPWDEGSVITDIDSMDEYTDYLRADN